MRGRRGVTLVVLALLLSVVIDVGVEVAVAATEAPWSDYRWWLYGGLGLAVAVLAVLHWRLGTGAAGGAGANVRQRAQDDGRIEDSPVKVNGVPATIRQHAKDRGVISGSGIDVE